jgi:RNA polymerase sigma factor (TIGR02999 family)
MPPSSDDATSILHRVSAGDPQAAAALLPLVYKELRRTAGRLFGSQSPSHTLQPTVLVHEAYMRMVSAKANAPNAWKDRSHFCRVAAKAMRQILINHARDKRAAKRGGGAVRQCMTLAEADSASAPIAADILDVHEALEKLAALDERQASICELRYFGGLNIEEVAEVLGVSKRAIELDWKMAKNWLAAQLK